MYVLQFLNHTHRVGYNTTVRRGTKWTTRLAPGEFVYLGKSSELISDVGKIVSILVCFFKDIPPYILNWEQDGSCHFLEGLRTRMEHVYESAIIDDDIVTCISYMVERES